MSPAISERILTYYFTAANLLKILKNLLKTESLGYCILQHVLIFHYIKILSLTV